MGRSSDHLQLVKWWVPQDLFRKSPKYIKDKKKTAEKHTEQEHRIGSGSLADLGRSKFQLFCLHRLGLYSFLWIEFPYIIQF